MPASAFAALDPAHARRVQLAVSCDDCAPLPKVPDAGQVRVVGGHRVQVMHNGVVVEEGCYFGPWMDEIIRCLGGHHEPQEELVVARILERLRETAGERVTAIELGSFWAYYLLWVLHEVPDAHVLALEPDPANLEVGRRNFALNGRTGRFVHGIVGGEPGTTMPFTAESDGTLYQVPVHDLASLLRIGEMDRVDVLLCDVQGGEAAFFPQAEALLRSGAVRFAVVSTHHHSISGDPLTHQRLLRFFAEVGAHVIAEHTVPESFSGDGLIAVSFDPADRDLTVAISRARAVDSLFGEPEHDLAAEQAHHREALATLAATDAALAATDEARAATQEALAAERDAHQRAAASLAAAEREVERLRAIEATRTWRWTSRPRHLYGQLRSRFATPS